MASGTSSASISVPGRGLNWPSPLERRAEIDTSLRRILVRHHWRDRVIQYPGEPNVTSNIAVYWIAWSSRTMTVERGAAKRTKLICPSR